MNHCVLCVDVCVCMCVYVCVCMCVYVCVCILVCTHLHVLEGFDVSLVYQVHR